MSKKAKAAGKGKLRPLVGCFLVVESETNTPTDTVRGEIKGQFRTQAEAEEWIVRDAIETFSEREPDLHNGPTEEWASDIYVCEVKRACRPVPMVKITARLIDTATMTPSANV